MIAVDASTLVLLAKSDLLDLFLESFPRKPFISPVVENKATRKGSFDALLIRERIKEKKIGIKRVVKQALVEKISKDFKLHLGEAETIVLCLENNWQLVGTDDFNAIKACMVLQVNYVSAMAILLKLNKEKRLDKKESLLKLEKLVLFGRYAGDIIADVRNKLR